MTRSNRSRTSSESRSISTIDSETDSSKTEETHDLIKETGAITLLLEDLHDRTNKPTLKATTAQCQWNSTL